MSSTRTMRRAVDLVNGHCLENEARRPWPSSMPSTAYPARSRAEFVDALTPIVRALARDRVHKPPETGAPE